jgi:hypothetical protein
VFENDVLAIHVSKVSETLNHPMVVTAFFFGAPRVPEDANLRDFARLRMTGRRQASDDHKTQGQKLASSHPITSPDDVDGSASSRGAFRSSGHKRGAAVHLLAAPPSDSLESH